MSALRVAVVVFVALIACAGRRGGTSTRPAALRARTLDLVWFMVDRRPDESCKDDSRGFVHVDLNTNAFSFAVCGGKKMVVTRTLQEREIAAVRELVGHLPRTPSVASQRSDAGAYMCSRLEWRDGEHTYDADRWLCEPGLKRPNDEAWTAFDLIDLLAGFRATANDGVCGGPLSIGCGADGSCSSRNGLVPHAFGRCTGNAGTPSIVCLALAYCPAGWKESSLDESECVGAKRSCRLVSAGCNDEQLCERCNPSESCPGGQKPAE